MVKSFKKCGISNAPGGTEEKALCEDLVSINGENAGNHNDSDDELNDFFNDELIIDEERKNLLESDDEEEFDEFTINDGYCTPEIYHSDNVLSICVVPNFGKVHYQVLVCS